MPARDDDENDRTRSCTGCWHHRTQAAARSRRHRLCPLAPALRRVGTLLRSQGVNAAHYHAGIADRSAVQDRFMRNELAVIVATVAFGMGVDKQDIRLIVHYGLPNSVEGYYQETGRAGRDGALSHCVLLYSEGDQATLTLLANQGQISIDTARSVYRAVQQIRQAARRGRSPSTALAQATGGDETTAHGGSGAARTGRSGAAPLRCAADGHLPALATAARLAAADAPTNALLAARRPGRQAHPEPRFRAPRRSRRAADRSSWRINW